MMSQSDRGSLGCVILWLLIPLNEWDVRRTGGVTENLSIIRTSLSNKVLS
ncbi:MAG: hypothetical protein LBU14_06340 [Candidatus Peribacteria bacterium]|nr:hypothetical protein [Candidatus Peribacteria bacterium]